MKRSSFVVARSLGAAVCVVAWTAQYPQPPTTHTRESATPRPCQETTEKNTEKNAKPRMQREPYRWKRWQRPCTRSPFPSGLQVDCTSRSTFPAPPPGPPSAPPGTYKSKAEQSRANQSRMLETTLETNCKHSRVDCYFTNKHAHNKIGVRVCFAFLSYEQHTHNTHTHTHYVRLSVLCSTPSSLPPHVPIHQHFKSLTDPHAEEEVALGHRPHHTHGLDLVTCPCRVIARGDGPKVVVDDGGGRVPLHRYPLGV